MATRARGPAGVRIEPLLASVGALATAHPAPAARAGDHGAPRPRSCGAPAAWRFRGTSTTRRTFR